MLKYVLYLAISNNEKSLTTGHKTSLERWKKEGKSKIV